MSINPYLENNPKKWRCLLIKNVVFIFSTPSQVCLLKTQGNRVCNYMWISKDCMTSDIYNHGSHNNHHYSLCQWQSLPRFRHGFCTRYYFLYNSDCAE